MLDLENSKALNAYLKTFVKGKGSFPVIKDEKINLKTTDDYKMFYRIIGANIPDDVKKYIFDRTLFSILTWGKDDIVKILSEKYSDTETKRFDADLEKKKQNYERASGADPTNNISTKLLLNMDEKTNQFYDDLRQNKEINIESSTVLGAKDAKESLESDYDVVSRYAMAFEFYRYLKYSVFGRKQMGADSDSVAGKSLEFKDVPLSKMSADSINAGFVAFVDKIQEIASYDAIYKAAEQDILKNGPKETADALEHKRRNAQEWEDFLNDLNDWKAKKPDKRGPKPTPPKELSEYEHDALNRFYEKIKSMQIDIYQHTIEPYTKIEYNTFVFLTEKIPSRKANGLNVIQLFPNIGDDVLKIENELSDIVPNFDALNRKIDQLRDLEDYVISLMRSFGLYKNSDSEHVKKAQQVFYDRDISKQDELTADEPLFDANDDDKFRKWYVYNWILSRIGDKGKRYVNSKAERQYWPEDLDAKPGKEQDDAMMKFAEFATIDKNDFDNLIKMSSKLIDDTLTLTIKMTVPEGWDDEAREFSETYFAVLNKYIQANKLRGFPFVPFDEILYELMGQFDDIEVLSNNPTVTINCKIDLTQFDNVSMEDYLNIPDKNTINAFKRKFNSPKFVYLDNIANLLASRSSTFFLLNIYDQMMRKKSPYRQFIMQAYKTDSEKDLSRRHAIESYQTGDKLEDLLKSILKTEFVEQDIGEMDSARDELKKEPTDVISRKELVNSEKYQPKTYEDTFERMRQIAIEIVESAGGSNTTKPDLDSMFDKCIERIADDLSTKPYGYYYLFGVKEISSTDELPKTPNDKIYMISATNKCYMAVSKEKTTKEGKVKKTETVRAWGEYDSLDIKKNWYNQFFYSAFNQNGQRILAAPVMAEIQKMDKFNGSMESASIAVTNMVMAIIDGTLKPGDLYSGEEPEVKPEATPSSAPAPAAAPEPTSTPPAPAEPPTPAPAPAAAPEPPAAAPTPPPATPPPAPPTTSSDPDSDLNDGEI